MKKLVSTFLATMLAFSLLAMFPEFAFSNEAEDTNLTLTTLADTKVVNNEVIAMAEEIATMEKVTNEDIQWIESSFGKVTVRSIDEEFSMIQIEPYSPETTQKGITTKNSQTESVPIESYRTIGLVVRTTAGYQEEVWDSTYTVCCRLVLSYDKIVFGNVTYVRAYYATSQIIDFYDVTQITGMYCDFNAWGPYYYDAASIYRNHAGDTQNDYMSVSEQYYGNFFDEKTLYSSYNGYWRVQAGPFLGGRIGNVMISTAVEYIRGGSYYVRTYGIVVPY